MTACPVEAESLTLEWTARATAPAPEAIEPDATFAGPNATDLVVELAHDLRSPLSAVLALAEVLYSEQAGPLNDTQRQQIALIHGAALGLCTMASDVLDLARRGPQVVSGKPAPFSVREVLAGVGDLCRPLAAEKGLELCFENPPADDRRRGHARPLSRALLNLTTNALKYTDSGHVIVAARASGLRRVEFSVRDTGGGLDGEALRHLYEPFREGRGSRRYCFSSAGLGLAICRKLVRAMGAELLVETRPGRGTRFSFELDLPPVPKTG